MRRVVVTGMGALSPLGLDMHETFRNLIAGKSGVALTTLFDTANFDVKIAAELKGYKPENYFDIKEAKRIGRFIQFALIATQQALLDSGLSLTNEERARTGVFIGTAVGGIPEMSENVLACADHPSKVDTFLVPMTITNMASGTVSVKFGFKGPNFCLSSACASGLHSIGEAANYIRSGVCDIMIAGGTEATITPACVAGFSAIRAMSKRNSDPEAASRPFDAGRDGFVIGEGAGVLVLEEYERAMARGARIYAEITGYGLSSDGTHITAPSKTGEGARAAMEMALRMAKLAPADIRYINAHGTSTPVGDAIESVAISLLFKEDVEGLWVNSTKSMIGHTLGASGAIEAIVSILSMSKGVVHPTINLQTPGAGCTLDYVANTARFRELKHVMKNSFGFGGTNASIIFSKV